jgi:uncharacterized RDD family membrane protein YckC
MNNLQYTGFGRRFLATIIDSILFLILFGSIFYFIYGIDFIEESSTFNTINVLLNYIIPFILVLVLWQYTSTTPGKAFFQVKIVDADTFKKPTKKQFFIRNISYYVSMLPLFLGFFWIIWDKKKQGWHDKLAHTVVVEPQREPEKKTVLGYIGYGLGVLVVVVFVIFLTIGLAVTSGVFPDENLYRVERLDRGILQELVNKKIINREEKLLYLNPTTGFFGFTDEGTAITNSAIIEYSTSAEGESIHKRFDFKDIYQLVINENFFEDDHNFKLIKKELPIPDFADDFAESQMESMEMIMLTIYDEENHLLFVDALLPKTTSGKEFKQELMGLWNKARE